MKYVKMLGLLAVAAAALMAFVGSASAATLTSPAGTVLGNGDVIKATSTHTQLHGSVSLTCTHSVVEGKITDTHHVKGEINHLTFSGCNNDTVIPLTNANKNYGELTIDGSGVVTAIGVEVTATVHRTLPFPHISITTHCIYNTGAGTVVGTLDDSSKTKATATLTISDATGGKPIPQTLTDGSCSDDAVWTGDYTVTSPDSLYVDP